jgi:YVTN family beta-propeller protein
MRSFVFLFLSFFICQLTFAQTAASLEQQLNKSRVRLPNGWHLSPAGRMLPLGDFPLNIAVSKTQRFIAVTNNGQSVQSLQLIDPKAEKILHSIIIPKSWYGLTFSEDEKFLYASGGNDNWILQYSIANNRLQLKDSIKLGAKWPAKISPAGITLDDQAGLLYVVTKENNALYVVELRTKKIVHEEKLGHEAYACLLSKDKKELYISSWGGDQVIVFNTATRSITSKIAVGDNPNELLLNKNGTLLFVANANDNSVSVIDIKQRKVLEVLNTALFPDAPTGSTANGLALCR